MYDRKTWAVLVICGTLLAVNLYYQGQNQAQQKDAKKRDEELQKANAPAAKEEVKETKAELTVEPTPPPTEEELVTLTNDQIEYTLTNIGGGIKFAEFQHEFQVGSKSDRVRVNRFGSGPIGALAGPDESPENVAYAYKKEDSVAGKKAVYIAKLPSGLIAKKTFTLNEGTEPGAPYLLDLELRLENGGANTANLSQWSVFWARRPRSIRRNGRTRPDFSGARAAVSTSRMARSSKAACFPPPRIASPARRK